MTDITLPKVEKFGNDLTIGYNGTTGSNNTVALGTKTNPTLLGTVAEVFGDTGTAWDRFKNGQTNIINKEIADQNLALQLENLDYNKALNEEIFTRADTAYQRQVADMRAAGLNPLMASGGAETGGSATPTTAAQNNYQHQDMGNISVIQGLGDLLNTVQNFKIGFAMDKKAMAEADSAEAQAQIDKSTAVDKIFQSLMDSEEKRLSVGRLFQDEEYNQTFGITSGMSPLERMTALKANQYGKTGRVDYNYDPKENSIYRNWYNRNPNEKYINVASQVVKDKLINALFSITGGFLK